MTRPVLHSNRSVADDGVEPGAVELAVTFLVVTNRTEAGVGWRDRRGGEESTVEVSVGEVDRAIRRRHRCEVDVVIVQAWDHRTATTVDDRLAGDGDDVGADRADV